MLLSIGESTAPLAALGGDKPLAERDELKPLAMHAEKKITSINYVSKAFLTKAGFTKADVRALAAWPSVEIRRPVLVPASHQSEGESV